MFSDSDSTAPDPGPVMGSLHWGRAKMRIAAPTFFVARRGPAQWDQQARMEASEETPSTCSWKLSFHFFLAAWADI